MTEAELDVSAVESLSWAYGLARTSPLPEDATALERDREAVAPRYDADRVVRRWADRGHRGAVDETT